MYPLLFLVIVPPKSQPAPRPKAAKGRAAKRAPASVDRGVIKNLNASGGSVTLQSAPDPGPFLLTAATSYWRGKRASSGGAFRPGDLVVLRLRRPRGGGPRTVVELDDPASFAWLAGLRRTTQQLTVSTCDDDALTGVVGPDKLPVAYRVTPSTRFVRAGAACAPSAYHAGDTAWVVGRGLSSGLAARAVADTKAAASELKAQLSSTVRGALVSLDLARHAVSVRTPEGALVSFPLDGTLQATLAGQDVPLQSLRPGMQVTLRVHRDASGARVVWRINRPKTAARKGKA